MSQQIIHGDCLDVLPRLQAKSVDLVFGSPPYEAQRTYGIGFDLKGKAWVEWAADRFEECCRVSRGLTAWVVQGYTRNYRWSAAPALLMAELHRRGICLRNPPLYKRNGIPGSGGPDWLRSDYEWIISAACGRLPWSDNTAMGHPPVCPPGGRPSSRQRSGKRTKGRDYQPPKLSNPGNVIDLGAVGGGNMGSKLAHENEAPFPERLPEFFIRSFCPPGGLVLDPFGGSGTTAAVAQRLGRCSISIDVRPSQCELMERRLAEHES
jgi:DNA modification methylase